MIGIITIGMTDDAIQAAIEITYIKRGQFSMMYMYRPLLNWTRKGLHSWDIRYTPRKAGQI